MPGSEFPGVYVPESFSNGPTIEGVSTSVAAFLGFAEAGPFTPTPVGFFDEYLEQFGGYSVPGFLPTAVQAFFANGGQQCWVLRLPAPPVDVTDTLAQLQPIPGISLVCCPEEHNVPGMTAALVQHCEQMRYRMAILAAPEGSVLAGCPPPEAQSANAAYYAPWILAENPAGGPAITVHPGGHVAGAIVANDLARGVSKAPANLSIADALALERNLTQQEQADLILRGINPLRSLPGRGNVIWGARTTSNDPQWKYINVRRYLLYLEQSIDTGTQWTVFEPNGEPLWTKLQQVIENFLLSEWRNGALCGSKPDQAFFVRCDRTTMTQDDIDSGRLVCLVGVAPIRPAEFVVFRIGQWTANGTST